MKRTAIFLDEKTKIFDYAKAHPKMGCRPFAEKLNNRKTPAVDILKNANQLRTDYDFVKGIYKICC